MRVDIISSVLNGERFLSEFIDSLRTQTFTDWVLWIRDDGSTDNTADILRAAAERDPRIRPLQLGGDRVGTAASFGWVLERIPVDAAFIMSGDADDVWLPTKIERTLMAMAAAERETPPETPILVHTDLVVVDERLNVVAPSFWAMAGFDPEPATLRRLVVRNVLTGPTFMFNGALRRLVGRTPAGALIQDWWYALVAAALGRIVVVREATVLYRQHGTNLVGARPDPARSLRSIPLAILRGLRNGPAYRLMVRRSALQARALLEQFDAQLSAPDREFLQRYSAIPEQGFVRRKINLLRLGLPREGRFIRMLGAVLRG